MVTEFSMGSGFMHDHLKIFILSDSLSDAYFSYFAFFQDKNC